MLLITRPEHDVTTTYLSKFSKVVIDEAEKRGMKVIDLHGARAIKSNFSTTGVKFIFLNGHGNATEIAGNGRKEILLKMGEDEKQTNSKIVYARACDAAQKLGESCVINGGAMAFIGYVGPFLFPIDTNKTTRPDIDTIAKPCIEVSNMIPLALLKGNTVLESVERSKQQTEKQLEYFNVHYDEENIMTVACLKWNRDILAFYGRGDAKIT